MSAPEQRNTMKGIHSKVSTHQQKFRAWLHFPEGHESSITRKGHPNGEESPHAALRALTMNGETGEFDGEPWLMEKMKRHGAVIRIECVRDE